MARVVGSSGAGGGDAGGDAGGGGGTGGEVLRGAPRGSGPSCEKVVKWKGAEVTRARWSAATATSS